MESLDQDGSGISSSGYGTDSILGRSDTLEDIDKNTIEISLDEDEEIKAVEESKDKIYDEKPAPPPLIPHIEEDEEEENPFADVHLNSHLQLSSTSMTPDNNILETKNNNGVKNGGEFEETKEFLEITVTDPQKMGDGMGSFMVYTVKTKTNISYFKKDIMIVNRRFSDFLGLHDKLNEKYLQNGRIIPPTPDKNMVGMAKIKLTKESDENIQEEFVERRRAALERYLNRTVRHPSLRTDPDLRDFLELEGNLPRSNQTSALSSKSVMKLINKVGDKVSNLTLKMDETDEWFVEKTQFIDALDIQLKKLHGITEALVEHRKSLANNTELLSDSLNKLAQVEENSKLSNAISKLSDVQYRVGRVHRGQSETDLYDLSELIKDYIGLVGAAKDSFSERVKAWQNWQQIANMLMKKRESKVKAEMQQKTERIEQLSREIAEYERQQEMAQENFDKISRLIKKEFDFFDNQRAIDFKKSILVYLEKMFRSQESIAEKWGNYLPHIQKIMED
uniref:PX domain-containing protein n=1 Tax=Lepeophtheirus salmonis TaxID=72036 RepID=A0A0K2U341_LEPSM